MPDESAIYSESQRLFGSGNYISALKYIHSLSQSLTKDAKYYNAIGALLVHLNRVFFARKFLEKSISLDPGNFKAHLNLAISYSSTGQDKRAFEYYEKAIELETGSKESAANYLSYLVTIGELEKSNTVAKLLESQEDESASCNYSLSLYYDKIGNQDDAIRHISQAIRKDPDREKYFLLLGNLLLGQQQYRESADVFWKLQDKKPDDIHYCQSLAMALYGLSDIEANLQICKRALQLAPESFEFNLNYHLLAPGIPLSEEELRRYWLRCAKNLRKLKNKLLEVKGHYIWTHLFFFAYYDRSVKRLLEAYGTIYHNHYCAFPDYPVLESKDETNKPISPRAKQRKIRLGFISQYFSYHSNSRAFEGLIRNIDRNKFDVFVINGPDSKSDDVRAKIEKDTSGVLNLQRGRKDLDDILGLELDILFYTDLGMHPYMSALASNRLAPIQMTGWGIPHTSGIRTIDYYISSDLAEPSNAQDHYTEKLVRLPSLPCCYLADEHLGEYQAPRDYFFLPPDAPLFGCLQSIQKLNPVFDRILERLAQRNPDAGFILVENRTYELTKRYMERVQQTAPTFANQLVFLKVMGPQEFLALSNSVDVLLDTVHYCSGISFYESTYTGTPTVTLEGKFLRSRLVAAAYRYIGLSDAPIAQSEEEYVEIATDLINNPAKLAAMKNELRTLARSKLYNDLTYVRSFESFCEQLELKSQKRNRYNQDQNVPT